MNFNTKNVSATNDKAQIVPGEKVSCDFVSMEVNDKGDLIILFKNESGTLKLTEFNIDPTHDKFLEKYADYQMARIKHIACGFVDVATVDAVEAPDYKGWASQLVEVLKPFFGKPCTLKVIVNKKNFPSVPLFPNFISTEKTPLDWSSNPQYDSYTYAQSTPDAAPADADATKGDEEGAEEEF